MFEARRYLSFGSGIFKINELKTVPAIFLCQFLLENVLCDIWVLGPKKLKKKELSDNISSQCEDS